MQKLPGFRDFYPNECAFRNYIFGTWRRVARNYGFQEYDGPTLEPTDLYRKKSGEELKTQLFRFNDPGERDVCMRPEMTPTLARLVAARERDFRKPIKWFSIAPFFRFEKAQRGRLREFYQINCDLIGDASPAADAELLALTVALFRAFGLTQSDFYVRLNNRELWARFLADRGLPPERLSEFLAVIDKLERDEESTTAKKLGAFGLSLGELKEFLATPTDQLPGFEELFRELRLRELEPFIQVDLTIVRGLDYYTGLVFEVFDRSRQNRALAGGGRYDGLIKTISDGAIDLPAAGFAIGDVVLGNLIEEIDHARARLEAHRRAARLQAFVIVAAEERRAEALKLVEQLRSQGYATDYSLHPMKVGKQFQQAEASGAQYALVIGQEWPLLKLKRLADRVEETVSLPELFQKLGLPPAYVPHPYL
jgi:histidyl-tRNA synthetase